MAAPDDTERTAALRRAHALNPRPGAVQDPVFTGDHRFFDPNDLVQVKYEMLRRVRREGQRVSETSRAFGFSRPSYYEAQTAFEEAGLPGLMPRRPGPRRAHKLSDVVLDRLEAALAEDASLNSAALARLAEEELGLSVHPRSVERALQRRRKRGGQTGP